MPASRMSKLKYILILPLSTYVIFYILSAIFTAPILDSGQLKQPAELALVGAIDRGETIKPLGVAEHLSLLKKKPSDKSLRLRKKKLDQELKKLLPTVSGWGEDGKGVHLTSAADKEKAAKVFKEGAYNVYVSDRISPNRTLRSVVSKECNALEYNVDELPNVSVIIIFTDEIFSALVRTIWSVINRTHKRLLREIILVDDFSEHGYLQATLRDYIDIYLNTVPGYEHAHGELIKLVRLPKRSGLIQARLKGARMARGDVLLFLDSHCEATDRWIEPLVQRIKENNKVFVCPVIDIIEDKSLEYQSAGPYYFQIGGFDWNGNFNWIKRNLASNGDERDPTKPVKSPTMAGGLFAVDRKFFFEVGSYDEDMQIWGGENLEMSFRVWQCGGRIEIHPCSHVGHIFRDFHPYSFNGIDSYGHNTLRAVHVWMDEFARYFLMLHPELHDRKYGDISSRLELRKQLKCKSFKWYLDHVYDKRKFVYDKNVLAYGWVKNKASDLCIDVLNRQETSDLPAGLYTCEHMNHPLEAITNQLFSYSRHREIRREEGCLTISDEKAEPKAEDDDIDHLSYAKTINSAASGTSVFHKVLLSPCEEPDYVSDSDHETSLTKFKEQIWRHESVHPRSNPNRLIVSESTGECLTTSGAHGNTDLLATKCDKSDPRQYWEFQIYANE